MMRMTRIDGRKKRKGFTLIELMVVLAILGLLFALVGPNIFKQQAEAKVQAAKNQVSMINETLRLYYSKFSKYPASIAELEKSGELSRKLRNDPWGNPYVYEPAYSDDGERVTGYNFYSIGPDQRKDTADDIGNKRMEKKDNQ